MKSKLILAASVALALAGPVSAQETYSTQPAQPEQTDQQTAQQNELNEANEAPGNRMTPVERPVAKASGQHCPVSSLAESVAPVISDTAPQPVAANTYDPCKDALTKVYPTVDRGHVAGDPPIIDHSSDIAPVTPTDSIASLPPSD